MRSLRKTVFEYVSLRVLNTSTVAKRDYREAEINDIKAIARELKKYPTRYFTCHCTGEAAYAVMKDIMGDQLQYVHSGEEVVIRSWHAAESARKMS